MAGRTKPQLFRDPALACQKAIPTPPKATRFLAGASRNGDPEADGTLLPKMTLEELFHQSLEALPLILRGLGREKRLSPEELEDLRSDIQIKLLEDDYRVLRRWNRRSSFKVYLVTVVYNIWSDLVRGEKGTVRVSAAAKRLGPPAPELEMLLGRHGLKLDQAYQLIKSRFPGLSLGEAEKIAAQINPRPGRRFEGVDVVARLQDLEPTGDKRLELQEMFVKKHEALALMHQILSELPKHDRLLLVRVHAEGVKFSHIAKSLGGSISGPCIGATKGSSRS